jgi:hypothetical protein
LAAGVGLTLGGVESASMDRTELRAAETAAAESSCEENNEITSPNQESVRRLSSRRDAHPEHNRSTKTNLRFMVQPSSPRRGRSTL